MKIILPTKITETEIEELSIANESAIPEYSADTTYSTGQKCISLYKGVPYIFGWFPPDEDGSATSRGVDPAKKHVMRREEMQADAESNTPEYKRYWLSMGPTNRMAMFDQRTSTPSSGEGEIMIKMRPPGINNGLALVNLSGVSHISVKVEDPVEGEVYYRESNLLNLADIIDFWAWFFVPPDNATELILTDLPNYSSALITITASNSSGEPLSIGEVICGEVVDIGVLLYPATSTYKTWQYKIIDDGGQVAIRNSTTVQETTYALRVDTLRVGWTKRMLQRVAGIPTVFIGSESHPITAVYGVYDRFDIVLAGALHSHGSLRVEEMVYEF